MANIAGTGGVVLGREGPITDGGNTAYCLIFSRPLRARHTLPATAQRRPRRRPVWRFLMFAASISVQEHVNSNVAAPAAAPVANSAASFHHLFRRKYRCPHAGPAYCRRSAPAGLAPQHWRASPKKSLRPPVLHRASTHVTSTTRSSSAPSNFRILEPTCFRRVACAAQKVAE